uniref:UBX domain-containing protein 2A isoform X2 n=2 Tax=Odontoceti TaxID=9722 RepID=A0A6J3PXS4_TURTR|nr:UBX domain-containing protein 2A isoform X2 [Tursiops truncatus]
MRQKKKRAFGGSMSDLVIESQVSGEVQHGQNAGKSLHGFNQRLTTYGVRQKRMKEVDNLESIKEEWVCETGSDHQPLSDNQQTNCEYFVDSLFEEAQKVGAKCLSPTEQKKQADVSIKLWKNGFTVNDDFRSYSDGASQQFLNSIKKGELPLELQGVFDKEEVDVKVEDKKNEVCMSTKPVFQPFSGQGHRLGSATPKIVSKAKTIEVENKNKLSTVPLNSLEPITNIQIWLANGERIVQKFNISHRSPEGSSSELLDQKS